MLLQNKLVDHGHSFQCSMCIVCNTFDRNHVTKLVLSDSFTRIRVKNYLVKEDLIQMHGILAICCLDLPASAYESVSLKN